jgi:hypothetical protein
MNGDPYQLFLGSKKCQLFRADLAQPQHAFTMHAMLPSAVDRPASADAKRRYAREISDATASGSMTDNYFLSIWIDGLILLTFEMVTLLHCLLIRHRSGISDARYEAQSCARRDWSRLPRSGQ